MFGALFGGAIAGPSTDGGNYYAFLMPGIFTMAMLFGLESTMTAVNADAAKGVTDRFRSLPISSGRGGARPVHRRHDQQRAGPGGAGGDRAAAGLVLDATASAAALAAFGLLMLLRFALLWVGIFIGLKAKGRSRLSAVQILVWPISMLSNRSSTRRPCPAGWARSRPGTRCRRPPPRPGSCSAIPGWNDGSWLAEHALLLAVGWPVLITAVFAPLADPGLPQARRLTRDAGRRPDALRMPGRRSSERDDPLPVSGRQGGGTT